MAENSKYVPLKDVGIGGIIVMRYGLTDQPEELVEPVAGKWNFSFFFSSPSIKIKSSSIFSSSSTFIFNFLNEFLFTLHFFFFFRESHQFFSFNIYSYACSHGP